MSSVRFNFCITVTAHSHRGDISSELRCQPGRIEGEAVSLLPTYTLTFHVLHLSHFSLAVFLSDVASSDFGRCGTSQRDASVSERDLETHLCSLSCV